MTEPSWLDSWGILITLAVVIGASIWIGIVAQRVVSRGAFLSSYFLGNRGLGVWAMALTATVQSGGTFMGFPSLVYSHGWTVALWIGSYMLVPLAGFAVIAKRLAQVSRRTESITVPDLFRNRFENRTIGLITSLLILFFLTFMMIAQFKAGGIIMKIAWPNSGVLALSEELPEEAQTNQAAAAQVGKSAPAAGGAKLDWPYQVGLIVFAATVVFYTLLGGFLASVWTDLFQSLLMFFGVVGLFWLTFTNPDVGSLEHATRVAVENTGEGFINAGGYSSDDRQFLTFGLSCSFFVVWIFGGMASPASITRVMAAKNTGTLRRSIFVLAVYNSFIYLPLICICMAARVIFPDLGSNSDEVIPRMAQWATKGIPGGALFSGLILSAPFGAVMATVSTYLVVISSGVVHDVYQRFFRPGASDLELKRMTYVTMIALGVVCWLANINPVQYLQALVVFCTSGGAAAFLVPAMMTCYWRRATAPGAIAAMITGAGTVLILFVTGLTMNWLYDYDPMIGQATRFRPYFLLGLEPVVWGIGLSALVGILVSLKTQPPREAHLDKLFS